MTSRLMICAVLACGLGVARADDAVLPPTEPVPVAVVVTVVAEPAVAPIPAPAEPPSCTDRSRVRYKRAFVRFLAEVARAAAH